MLQQQQQFVVQLAKQKELKYDELSKEQLCHNLDKIHTPQSAAATTKSTANKATSTTKSTTTTKTSETSTAPT